MSNKNENVTEVKEVQKSEVEVLREQNKILNDKLISAIANQKLSDKTLKSDNCKTFASYHFSMSAFKDNIFKMFNKKILKSEYIVTDSDNEMNVTKSFKNDFLEIVNKALVEKYDL